MFGKDSNSISSILINIKMEDTQLLNYLSSMCSSPTELVLHWDSTTRVLKCITGLVRNDPCFASIMVNGLELTHDSFVLLPSNLSMFSNEYLDGMVPILPSQSISSELLICEVSDPFVEGWACHECSMIYESDR